MADTDTIPPMSRRDVWLTIALAIARDSLPEPERVTLHSWGSVTIEVGTLGEYRAWRDHLELTDHTPVDRAGFPGYTDQQPRWIHDAHASRAGWRWNVHTCVDVPSRDPGPSPLAEQVIAAIGGAA